MKRVLPLLVLLGACAQPPAPPAPAHAPGVAVPAEVEETYRAAAKAGTPVYRIDPQASLIAVTVRRAGLMARLGHDHVVASHGLRGYAAPGLNRADIAFRLDQLSIDEPRLLRDAAISTQPSAEAIEGTRKNMLGPALDAQRYPVVALHAESGKPGKLRVAITLHGLTRWLDLPATFQADPGELSVQGTARLKQSDFGITPFSVGGGLLAVQDELEIRYAIVARRSRVQ
jgi:hypothetical protein